MSQAILISKLLHHFVTSTHNFFLQMILNQISHWIEYSHHFVTPTHSVYGVRTHGGGSTLGPNNNGASRNNGCKVLGTNFLPNRKHNDVVFPL